AFEGSPQHPVSQALTKPIETFNLQQEYFLEIIDGMEMDLFQTRYPSFNELNLYCYRAASAVGLLATEIFGYQHRDTLKYAHDLGLALQLTNILRDVTEDAQRGRIYIPQDELVQFGVSEKDILLGNMSENMRNLLEHQAKRAENYYIQAWSKLPDEDRYAQVSGIIMGEIYHAILGRIEKQHFEVINKRIRLSPFKKLWIAWMTVMREKRQNKKSKTISK
ncbi:MAG: squalene/phytoene synthase family protein, partial [Gammaproteobacteria bacterium]|nr:squalene/phytoene synthase family protein [Gammaproteobacteria bacterium]